MSAELAARRSLGGYLESVLAALAGGPDPDWTAWAHCLAAALGELLAATGQVPDAGPQPVGLAAVRSALETSRPGGRPSALERTAEIVSGSRSAAGFEMAGGACLTGADLRTALGGLADAAELLEHRAGQFCPDCAVSPAELCDEHAADLDAAGAYRQLARTLGEAL